MVVPTLQDSDQDTHGEWRLKNKECEILAHGKHLVSVNFCYHTLAQ